MSETTNRAAPVAPPVITSSEAAVAFGLWLTVAWTCLLGYGLVRLVQLAI